MTKKQKKILTRVLITTLALVLSFIFKVRDLGLPGLFIYIAIYLFIGYDVLRKSFLGIKNGQVFDENFLMSIATIGAFIIKEYPEAVAVMLFYQVGELFQSYAVGKSRESISSLMDIRPDYANIEKDGELVQVDPDDIEIGDIIIVKPGEKVPLDGIIINGNTSLNTAALTGESLPRDAVVGDDIISGSINLTGLIQVEVTKEFDESTVSKILDLVENSSIKKAETEKFITKFAKYYTPAVVFGALALFLIPPLFFKGQWDDWFARSLTFLVISCPCALVVSVPMSFFGGIGGASKQGILVKGSNYLEILSQTEIMVFDKTGTLTEGSFDVSVVHPENNLTEEELLEITALAESYSDHPISLSLRKAYGRDIDKSRIQDAKEIAGHGVEAVVDGKNISIGNSKLMEKLNLKVDNCDVVGTIIHVAIDGEYAGHIVIADKIKEDAKIAIKSLKDHGVKRTDRKSVV